MDSASALEQACADMPAIDARIVHGQLPAEIIGVLKLLAKFDQADQVRVFGSVAKGKEKPGDVDIYIDLRPMSFDDSKQLDRFQPLLRIAHRYPGSFDPFLRFEGSLVVRSDDCRSWTNAKFARALQKDMDACNVPLATVLELAGLALNPDAVKPPAFDRFLSSACENHEAGFHFEEGGCWGMALALQEKLAGQILVSDGFVHAYVQKDGALYDWRGRAQPVDGLRLVTPEQVITVAAAHGVDRQALDADKAWADQVIATALDLAIQESIPNEDSLDTDRVTSSPRC